MQTKEMLKKLMALAAIVCLGLAAQAAATYDYIAEVLVSKYAEKDPTTSDENAKCYSVYCLTQEAAQQAMGTTDKVTCETYAAWLGENFEANRQATTNNAQAVSYDSRTVAQYVFAYALGSDFSELNDALAVVFFKNEDGDLAYNVLASKDGDTQFNCDDEYYGSSGWKAVTPAAPIEPMISDVTARQRYPWNGKVDIAYTASNVLAAAEAKSMDAELKVAAIDKSVTPWTTNVAEAACLFVGPRGGVALTTEAALSNGAHRIVWDMNAQGLSNKSDRVVFTVSAEGTKKQEPGLCFTALADDSTVTIDMKNYNLEYSCDGGQSWASDNTEKSFTVTLKTGDKLLVRATSAGNKAVCYYMNDDCEECYPFKATGNLKLSGNVMYLLKQDGSQTEITDENVIKSEVLGTCYCFQRLFNACTGITDASELKLANNTRKYCYKFMFEGCTGLTKVPALPVMTLAEGCYWAMFWECSSLVTVDENLLPATTMVEDCYFEMFQFCTALTQAPKLPATDLPVRTCYANMFYGCTSLTTAPLLGAIRMPRVEGGTITGQMANMFLGCSKLSSVTLLATEIYDYSDVNSALRNWLDDAGTEATNPTLHVVKGMADNETITKNKPSNWKIVEDAK